jgi:hypothetical protein
MQPGYLVLKEKITAGDHQANLPWFCHVGDILSGLAPKLRIVFFSYRKLGISQSSTGV